MRTALFLLLLLAVAAIPGSTFPQRSIDATRTAQWITEHPSAGPLLDRLGFFEVYASPWFAAVYLLLFVSLIGCVVPRTRIHWHQLRSRPPRAPRRLERLPAHAEETLDGTPEEVRERLRESLRRRRYRVHAHDDTTLSAEKGYARETGNLVFHLALVGVLVGVAWGHLLGWKGDVIVPVGQTFANTLSRYDTFSPGPWVDPNDLAPYTIRLDAMDVTFETEDTGRGQFGMPRDFRASTTFTDADGSSSRREISVNHPLETGAGSVFLLGNGYAPHITVKDADGTVVYSDATPFLAQDNNYTSVGAVKVPGAEPDDLGFAGFFLPTGVIDDESGPHSVFPDTLDPQLVLTAFSGELFPDGTPQSVYTLDTTAMTPLKGKDGADQLRILLRPGESYELPGNRGTVTFDGVERFAGLSIRTDPGKTLTLVSALLALAGLVLSLVVRRRRVFVRVGPAEAPGRTVVSVGGLAKDDDEGMADEVAAVLTAPEGTR
ncbi:cytochrome c biogenesis protein ResB [Phycicoccus endophyticus]|uniref:Cytochrome c biogenesis protein ResB n=2 Tax=Phycicoccus endophyticus TaxID=1690220 RepID=A0A7G9R607_9MICO|nr:cytochrome c biogenesis protein ResB [Phycicoccus endophyticus]QNN51032.1 cytochrome c biogenesis protein ResB [Phycicoccus endophyticus]